MILFIKHVFICTIRSVFRLWKILPRGMKLFTTDLHIRKKDEITIIKQETLLVGMNLR